MQIRTRPVAARDEARWRALWAGYLAFYQTTLPDEVTDLTWRRLLDAAEPVHCLVAEAGGEILGIVNYVFHRATWTASSYCYLEDLFTAPEARGRGAGRALIEAVYAAARAAGATRVYWLTHESNATARQLYDAVAENAGFIQYRKTIAP
ncbi:N-acetyltransferase [Camelimonas fluminis]|uniref:GNAT family N-acetyltransferase n=1 Tax=Camelimonas fluminis TaxID=1576911 RepID=A0ABV7UC08_9HYPH|nr:GNAT family N-acetyltransferase [Camelimonas fluminis]GHE48797.1 N-acetyltransferase [Camelimonas fluminis]